MRSLSKEHAHFIRIAKERLEYAMEEGNYPSFSYLVETGLIDIKENEKIIGFYEAYRDDNNISRLDEYLNILQMQRSLEEKEKVRRKSGYKSYKQRRLDQIHERQKVKKEAREQEIDEEMEQKKLEAHRQQKEALQFNE